jgi:tetratricopeptide (TPR) repeat protein
MINPINSLVAWLSEFSLVFAMNRQNWDSAVRHSSRALLIKPNDPDLLGMRGVALLSLGHAEHAIKDLSRALELRPTADTYINRAIAYRDAGEFNRSIADCDEALRLRPQDLSVYLEKAQTYQKSGSFAEAVDNIKTVLKHDNDPELYRQLAETQAAAGDWDAALSTWQQALEISPNDPEILLSRGKAYEKHGETDKANADFERAGHK